MSIIEPSPDRPSKIQFSFGAYPLFLLSIYNSIIQSESVQPKVGDAFEVWTFFAADNPIIIESSRIVRYDFCNRNVMSSSEQEVI